jgi:hypothetical protein
MKVSAHAPTALLSGREPQHLLDMRLGGPKRRYKRGCEENTVYVTSVKGDSFIAKNRKQLNADGATNFDFMMAEKT